MVGKWQKTPEFDNGDTLHACAWEDSPAGVQPGLTSASSDQLYDDEDSQVGMGSKFFSGTFSLDSEKRGSDVGKLAKIVIFPDFFSRFRIVWFGH